MAHIAQTPDRICMWLDYEFKVYDFSVDWIILPEVGGVYIFASLRGSPSEWVPLYIGETESFADRVPGHEKLEQLRQLEVSHVHIFEVKNEAERKGIEKELLQSYIFRLNEQTG